MSLGIKISHKNGVIDRDGRTYAYGSWIPPWKPVPGKEEIVMPRPMWSIEQEIYWRLTNGKQVPPGSRDRKHHFMQFVNCIWGQDDSIYPFTWNPFAENILEKKLEHSFLMVAGSGSSGKSRFAGVWGIANFLFDPFNTKVLVTSLTLKAAKGKIWGDIAEAWQQACKVVAESYGCQDPARYESYMPGRILKDGIIRYTHNGIDTDKAGLELVPGGVSQAKDSAEKIQGYKRGRIFGILDELATLDHGLMSTFESNIYTNPSVDIMGLFNPDSHYDPAGKASAPVDGWHTVDINTQGWKNRMGWTMRLDGALSPNVLAGYDKYPGLLSKTYYESQKVALGEHSKEFYKMFRAHFSSEGSKDAIYSQQDIEKYEANRPITTEWISPPTRCAFMDPSFVVDGDRCIVAIGECGDAMIDGRIRRVLSIIKVERIDADIRSNDSKVEQVVAGFISICKQYNVQPRYAGLDSTGSQLSALIIRDWSNEFLQVNFGEAASDTPISATDPTPARDKYARKVDEIWFMPRALIRCKQLRGLPDEAISEMTARHYSLGANNKIKVETKREMKQRCLRSPDIADATLSLAHLCSIRLSLVPVEFAGFFNKQAMKTPELNPLAPQTPQEEPLYDLDLRYPDAGLLWD